MALSYNPQGTANRPAAARSAAPGAGLGWPEGALTARTQSVSSASEARIGGLGWPGSPGSIVPGSIVAGPIESEQDAGQGSRGVQVDEARSEAGDGEVDGALGSRGAFMLKPYSDRPDGYLGNQRITEDRLYAIVRRAREAGFQVSAHAIGDAANRMVLNVYERVLKEKPDPNHRYRIEHAQVVALEDIPRFARLGVIPSMQTIHATSDKNMAEKRIGPERIKGAYAWRKFLDSGSIIANGTDAPVEPVNPFYGLYAGVTRQDRDGKPEGGWYPEERMTREEALKSYTLWGAYAAFEEKIKGSIEPGKLADFVVIDKDYMNCPAREIKDIKVLQTVLGGKVVYPVREVSGQSSPATTK